MVFIPQEHETRNIRVSIDLANYATKKDLENVSTTGGIDTTNFVKQDDLKN